MEKETEEKKVEVADTLKGNSLFPFFVLLLAIILTLGYLGFSSYNLYILAQADVGANMWWNEAFQILINVATFLGVVAILEDRAKNKNK